MLINTGSCDFRKTYYTVDYGSYWRTESSLALMPDTFISNSLHQAMIAAYSEVTNIPTYDIHEEYCVIVRVYHPDKTTQVIELSTVDQLQPIR